MNYTDLLLNIFYSKWLSYYTIYDDKTISIRSKVHLKRDGKKLIIERKKKSNQNADYRTIANLLSIVVRLTIQLKGRFIYVYMDICSMYQNQCIFMMKITRERYITATATDLYTFQIKYKIQ